MDTVVAVQLILVSWLLRINTLIQWLGLSLHLDFIDRLPHTDILYKLLHFLY